MKPPRLQAFHSHSPSALMPVRSMGRFGEAAPQRYGRHRFDVILRWHSGLKSGTAHSSLTTRSRPVFCLSGILNRTFRVRQVWIAASLSCCCRPRLPRGGGIRNFRTPRRLWEDELVQRQIRYCLPQPSVLFLEPLQFLELVFLTLLPFFRNSWSCIGRPLVVDKLSWRRSAQLTCRDSVCRSARAHIGHICPANTYD